MCFGNDCRVYGWGDYARFHTNKDFPPCGNENHCGDENAEIVLISGELEAERNHV